MRHELHTEIDVDAPSEIVWDILSDLERYTEWNPFIVSAVGEPAVGERLTNRLQPPDGGTRVVHRELFNGALVRFMRKSLDTRTREGFEAMNAALKARAEALA